MKGITSNYHTLQVLKTAYPELRKAIISNCIREIWTVEVNEFWMFQMGNLRSPIAVNESCKRINNISQGRR